MKSIRACCKNKIMKLIFLLSISVFLVGCASTEGDDDEVTTSSYNGHASWGLKADADSSGNIYFAGIAYGDITSDSDTSEADIFLTKYDSSGNRLWLRQLGTDETDYVQDIAVSTSDAIYIAGYTDGELEADATQDGSDIFVMKYDSTGTRQWVKQLGTGGVDHCWGMALDASDNVYLIGDTTGVITGTDVNNDRGIDLILIKLNAAGTQEWTRQLGSDDMITTNTPAKSYGVSVSIDGSGDIVIGGNTNDTIGGDRIGETDIFLAKYNSSGTQIWSKQIGTAYIDYVEEVGTAANGNIYFTGYSYGTVDASYDYSDYSESHTYSELFLFKFDSFGQQVWVNQYGTAAFDRGNALVLDSSENIYIAGNTNGDLTSDNYGSYDYFIMKIDSGGTLAWAIQNGSEYYDTVDGITLGTGDSVCITGRTYGELDSLSNDDTAFSAFITRYSNSGSRLWTDLF
jgi:beta-propeller repeat-containing protein